MNDFEYVHAISAYAMQAAQAIYQEEMIEDLAAVKIAEFERVYGKVGQ